MLCIKSDKIIMFGEISRLKPKFKKRSSILNDSNIFHELLLNILYLEV